MKLVNVREKDEWIRHHDFTFDIALSYNQRDIPILLRVYGIV